MQSPLEDLIRLVLTEGEIPPGVISLASTIQKGYRITNPVGALSRGVMSDLQFMVWVLGASGGSATRQSLLKLPKGKSIILHAVNPLTDKKFAGRSGQSEEDANAEGKWFYSISPGHYGLTQKGWDLYNQVTDSTNSGFKAQQEIIKKEKKEKAVARKAKKDKLNARLGDVHGPNLSNTEFEDLYFRPSVSLAALASNPATPGKFLPYLFFEYPKLVSQNPGWILTKMSASTTEFNNVLMIGFTRRSRNFVHNFNKLDRDDIQFLVDISGEVDWIGTRLGSILSINSESIDPKLMSTIHTRTASDFVKREIEKILNRSEK